MTRTAATGRLAPRAPITEVWPRDIVWAAPILNYSGYGEEGRGFLAALARIGAPIAAVHVGEKSQELLAELPSDPELAAVLERAQARRPLAGCVAVLHVPGHAARRVEGASKSIARTMFETDGLPKDWVDSLNKMDEIWVPCTHNLESFVGAGVTAPIEVVPEGVDARAFRPGIPALHIPGARGTTFLSVFEWTNRKAPDLLLAAWAEAFRPDERVSLVIRAFPPGTYDGDSTLFIDELIDRQLARIGKIRAEVAPIVVLGRSLPRAAMPKLMAACDVYVGVSRGEGWGRPLLEAMACGKTAIGTRWGGNVDFMDDENSLLVDTDGLVEIDEAMEFAFYRGQRWANPSLDQFVEQLRRAGHDHGLRRRVGGKARAAVERRWQWSRVVRTAEARLRALMRSAALPS